MTLTLFPAIDLRHGDVVRLRQGDPNAQDTYGSDPAQVARNWAEQGAEWLHVVNLDGAFDDTGLPINLQRLGEIRSATPIPIQFGGGIRSLAAVEHALAIGATRVILGTVLLEVPDLAAQAVRRFGSQAIVAGIDAREGWVATHGWLETTRVSAVELAKRLAGQGVERIVFTDIARDGMLEGLNLVATVELGRSSGVRTIASGGVASLADVRAAALAGPEIEGVIIGQALYRAAFTLDAALRLTQQIDQEQKAC
jgi:phosphoribosylformimino-5-aminoimidazole carboxamide ribotide isomerase